MRVLPLTEQAQWLAAHALPADPYEHGGEAFEFFLQFYSPKTLASIECFTKALLDYAGVGGDVMMTVMDTEGPYDYDVRLFDKLRFPVGEPKIISDAPAHLFAAEELEDLIPMFGLTVAWQWEAYLHMPRTRTVLLNWEGEIFDFWTDDQSVFAGVSKMLKPFGLKETETAQQDAAPNGGPGTHLGNSGVAEGPPSVS